MFKAARGDNVLLQTACELPDLHAPRCDIEKIVEVVIAHGHEDFEVEDYFIQCQIQRTSGKTKLLWAKKPV
jgi:hypothetical protein